MDSVISQQAEPAWLDLARSLLETFVGVPLVEKLTDDELLRLSGFFDALLFATQESAWREGWLRGYNVGELQGRWILADDLRAVEESRSPKLRLH